MDNKDVKKSETPELELPKSSNEKNADFSSIFNIESEEKANKNNNMENKEQEHETQPRQIKKKQVFNGEDKLLYEIKPEKEGNPIVPLMFFMVLITVILALPYITEKVSFEFKGTGNSGNQNEQVQEPEFYFFNRSTVRGKIGNLEFTNFVKSIGANNEYHVSFNITNVAEKTYQYDKKYYLVLYNEKEQILYRSLIHSYESIGALAAKQITLNISKQAYEESDRFKIMELSTKSYPEVKLTEKQGEYEVMTCVFGFNTVTYYFLDGELNEIYDVYEQESTTEKYFELKELYKGYTQKYEEVNNFESTFIETDTYFQQVNRFDLKIIPDASLSKLQTYRFFKYKEKKEVVSFEMEAQAYICS